MADGTRRGAQLSPTPAWTTITDAPLKGFCLAREANLLLAWDESQTIHLIDGQGARIHSERAPAPVIACSISDTGTLIALLLGGPRLLLLDHDLSPISDRPAPGGSNGVEVDPHGRFLAVGSRSTETTFFTRHGRVAGKLETRQPLTLMRFVPGLPVFLAATSLGHLMAVGLEAAGSADSLRFEPIWEQRLLSNLGRIECTGDGSLVLASCYNLGLQRYDLEGHNEGAYHLGGTVTHAVPDFAGRLIAAATMEGELFLLNQAGNIRWRTTLPRPANALAIDPLGRALIYGLPTGEITKLDIEARAGHPVSAPAPAAVPARPGAPGAGPRAVAAVAGEPPAAAFASGGSIRSPAWSVPIARSDEEASNAEPAVLDEPPRVACLTRTNRLQLFSAEGQALGQTPELNGAGRIVRSAPGWLAAATDRSLLLYDARRKGAHRVDLNLYQLTHLEVRPDDYGLAVIQERDRLGRATVAGRWVWKHELRSPVENLAIGPGAFTAVSTEAGELLVFDPTGEPAGRYQTSPAEPLLLCEAPPTAAVPGLTWITLARRAQVLRGHRADGRVIWESPTPWEAWSLQRVGAHAVVAAPDGRAQAFDVAGYLTAQAQAESSPSEFIAGPRGEVWRLVRRDSQLLCTDLSGQVRWRAVFTVTPGPMVGSPLGVAVLHGRELAFFPNPESL